VFLGVHLPGLVREGRAGRVLPHPASRRRGVQVVLGEPALERTFGGDVVIGRALEQVHSDQTGAPGGMLAPQAERGPNRGGRLRMFRRGLMVIRRDARGAEASEPGEQAPDRRQWPLDRLCDLGGSTALFPEVEHRESNGDRSGAWHDFVSHERRR
jgi:hypothetical protein